MYKHLYIYLILLISNSNIDLVNCIYIYIRYIFCIHIYLLNRFMLTLKYVLDIYSYIYIYMGRSKFNRFMGYQGCLNLPHLHPMLKRFWDKSLRMTGSCSSRIFAPTPWQRRLTWWTGLVWFFRRMKHMPPRWSMVHCPIKIWCSTAEQPKYQDFFPSKCQGFPHRKIQ